MTDYNPSQSHMGVLFPCHSLILQFYVNNGFLDMFCFNRSSDLFLGLPFNIASSSLLLILISKVCKLTPRFLNITLGDSHIYEQHYNAVFTQIQRIPYKSPTLSINKDLHSIEDIEKLTFQDITLTSYQYYPSIKAKMVP
jgi:thymidylate synthase